MNFVSRMESQRERSIRAPTWFWIVPRWNLRLPGDGDGFSERPERPRWALRLTIYAVAARSSYSAYASRMRSRMRSWAAVSAIGRSSVKLRFSPLTEY